MTVQLTNSPETANIARIFYKYDILTLEIADLVSDVQSLVIPVSGCYLLNLGCTLRPGCPGGDCFISLNRRERLLSHGRTDIVELDEDDLLQVKQAGQLLYQLI